jgi:hypothetical protein
MNCKECGKELEQVKGKEQKQYCSDKCRKRFQRKNKDSAFLSQKQGLENAPESATIDELRTDDTQHRTDLTPDKGTSNTEQILNWAQPDCQCKHCRNVHKTRPEARLNHGSYMTAAELEQNGYKYNRVSLPGDKDYKGIALAS